MPRIALITGGGHGIGRAIALALARAGCAVALGGRNGDAIESTGLEARAMGVKALAVTLDVTVPASVTESLRRVTEELGPVDVLVNNAGIAESASLAKTDRALWDRHFLVNVTGPYLLTRQTLPGMLARRWGRVINVASLAGLHGSPYVTAYTASKHALVGFTRALATEVADKGVTVNAICPGYVATDMVWNGARNIAARTGRSYDDAVQSMARMNPGGRLIEADEVAAAAASLLDDDSTNGETLVLDGTAPAPTRRQP
jgi:NAD(P)-dependent dehydrogenase (short-subunit alcohol dehydrogenase family)